MEEFKLDIDRLHRVYFDRSPRRGAGKSVLFAYEIIGIAQTRAFSWDKINRPIAIYCNSPLRTAKNVMDLVERICKSEKVPFQRKDTFTFVVIDTAFVVCREINDYDTTWYRSDLDIDEATFFKSELTVNKLYSFCK